MSSIETKNLLYDFLNKPKFRIGRHMLLIIIFTLIAIGQLLFVFGNLKEPLGSRFYLFGIFNTIAILTFVYFNFYTLVPRFLLKNKYMEYLMILIISTTLYLIFKGLIESFLISQLGIIRHFNGVTLLDMLSNLILYTICIASSSISVLFKQWMTDTERIDDLKNKRLKSSVDELKNQISPKSLSLVLDYVSGKVKTNSKEASEILFILSDVLRYELYDCKREKVILESDIEFIKKYLSLEQLKFSNSLVYTIEVEGKTNLFIPPYTFIPIIQKIIEQQPKELLMQFYVEGNMVNFECKVSGVDLSKCDFSKEEQRLKDIYVNDLKILINVESIEMQLHICLKK